MRSITTIILGLVAVAGLTGTGWFYSEHSNAMQQIETISSKVAETKGQSDRNKSLLEIANSEVAALQAVLAKSKAENAAGVKALMASKAQLKTEQANSLAAAKKSESELSLAKTAAQKSMSEFSTAKAELQKAQSEKAASAKSLMDAKSALKGLETQLQSVQKTASMETKARKRVEAELARIKALGGN